MLDLDQGKLVHLISMAVREDVCTKKKELIMILRLVDNDNADDNEFNSEWEINPHILIVIFCKNTDNHSKEN